MPVNIQGGNSAQFIAEFLTTAGATTTPSSATLVIVYTSLAGISTITTISMTVTGTYYTATWDTSVAAFGNANWSITAPGQSAATTGVLRILDP